MSSTHLSLHYHIVFGTKNHEPMIQPAWRRDLHAYLGGIIRTADGIAESVGGVSDHVHLLIGLRAKHRLADVLRELKAVSSSWVHNEIGMRAFAWQEGYGAFTVSAFQCEAIRPYIEQQDEHRTRAFREEYLELLRRSGVEFDERYLQFNAPAGAWYVLYSGQSVAVRPRLISERPFGSARCVLSSGTDRFERAMLRRLVSNDGEKFHLALYRAICFKFSLEHQRSRVAPDVA